MKSMVLLLQETVSIIGKGDWPLDTGGVTMAELSASLPALVPSCQYFPLESRLMMVFVSGEFI